MFRCLELKIRAILGAVHPGSTFLRGGLRTCAAGSRIERSREEGRADLSKTRSGDSASRNAGQVRKAGRSARPSIERSLQVLTHIAASGRPLALAEICEQLALPKSTASRICERLRRSGYLVHEPGGKHTVIGPRLFRLGLDVVRNSGANSRRHAVLVELVEEIGETCNLTMLAGGEVLYLDRVETRWPLRLALEPGSRVPLHCTASGKLFLSAMAPGERDALLQGMELTPCTPRSLTNLSRLMREVKRIAERGYSLDNEEFITGLVAVAVPVVDESGQPVAALACHAPVARLDLRGAVALVPRLRQAAQRIAATAKSGEP